MVKKIVAKIKKFFYYGNRNFADYIKFLDEAKNNGFRFVPLKEFIKEREVGEKIIGLRHDVDSELNHALKIAEIEHRANIKATYFVLHTAKYFYKDIKNDILNDKIIKKLKCLQNTFGHEIGLHLDLMPIEIIYKKDPSLYLKQLLDYLKKEGINIIGVAPHGNLFHQLYRKENMINNKEVKNHIFADPYTEFDLKKFNLNYEAYSLDHDIYYSDASFIDQKRWDFSVIENDFFHGNKRAIILTHTIHWAYSKFHYYTLNLFITINYFLKYLHELFQYRRSK